MTASDALLIILPRGGNGCSVFIRQNLCYTVLRTCPNGLYGKEAFRWVRTIEALQTILPVLLALSIGVLCRRKRLISRGGVDALKTVAVNIGLPAVLISTFAAG